MNQCQVIKSDGQQCLRQVIWKKTKSNTSSLTPFRCWQHQIVNQMGGQLIGQGTFGCVYRQPLKCQNNLPLDIKYRHDVMKVSEKDNVTNELYYGLQIRKLDPQMQYFLPLTGDQCDIQPSEHDLEKCRVYQKSNNKTNFRGYFLPTGGHTLDYYVDHNLITIDQLWTWIDHLFKGLELLQSIYIVHNDIKFNNIVINAEGQIRLIDFGLAFATTDNIPFYHSHWYPMFIQMIKTTHNLDYFYHEFENLAKFDTPDYIKGSSNDIILNLYQHSKKQTSYINNVVLPHIYQIDSYRLCECFNDEIINYKNNHDIFMMQNPTLMTGIIELINANTNLDPSLCWDVQSSRQFIDNINQIHAKSKLESTQHFKGNLKPNQNLNKNNELSKSYQSLPLQTSNKLKPPTGTRN